MGLMLFLELIGLQGFAPLFIGIRSTDPYDVSSVLYHKGDQIKGPYLEPKP